MSWSQRAGYTPADPLGLNAQALDRLWQAAQERWAPATSALDGAFGAMGDFVGEDIQRAIDAIRETAPPARHVVNQIVDILSSPCEEDWTIIIDTLLPAMGAAFWLLATPSPAEIVENYLNPARGPGQTKGGRDNTSRQRAKSRSGRTRRSWTRFTDVDELVAAGMPLSGAVQGRATSLPERWIFHGIAGLDILALTAMLADITRDGMVLWQSGLMEKRMCNDAMDFWQTAFMTAVNKEGFDVPHGIPPWSVSVQKGEKPGIGTIGVPLFPVAGGASVSLQVDHAPYGGDEPFFSIYSLIASHADGSTTVKNFPVEIQPGQTSHAVAMDIGFNSCIQLSMGSNLSISQDVYGPCDFVMWGTFDL